MVVLRAGLYERVSTDEQAKYGFSIKTQIDALEEHCKENKMKIESLSYLLSWCAWHAYL